MLQIAYDADAQKLWLGFNNTWKDGSYGNTGNPGAGTNPTSTTITGGFLVGNFYNSTGSLNTGQRPFAYTAPSGFKALCDTNLPAPVVAKSSDYFQTVLWTGNSSTQTVSGLSFSPDLVWLKCRNDAYGHRLLDTVRGATIGLASQSTAAESTESTGLTAFNSDGFTLGSNVTYNESAKTYVGWAFDAGTTTTTNTAGSITSSVRANASAGFSIVAYTGNGTSGATIGHSLGVAPSLILVKCRSNAAGWLVYHSSIGATKYLALESTAAAGTYSGAWNDTAPTSTVFSVGNDSSVNTSTRTYVAYCFSPLVGYSAMGSYVGNGSSDGVFQWCGFRPRFLLIKRTDTTGSWVMLDAARDPTNVLSPYLLAESSGAEDSAGAFDWLDFTANGFKQRNTGAWHNASGGTYVWAAFAESPFQYARAR